MSYANAAASNAPPPSREEIHYLLAHFSVDIEPEELVSGLQRIAKISPYGIRPHARGALLAFKSKEDSIKAAEKPLSIGRNIIPLTCFPEILTPAKERGRRWRIFGVPFWMSAEDLKAALTTPSITVTAVKLETVRNHPTTRTAFATFWVKQDDQVPTLKEIAGEKVLIFDPIKPPKTTKPKDETLSEKENRKAESPKKTGIPTISNPQATVIQEISPQKPATPPKQLVRSADQLSPQDPPAKKIDAKATPPKNPIIQPTECNLWVASIDSRKCGISGSDLKIGLADSNINTICCVKRDRLWFVCDKEVSAEALEKTRIRPTVLTKHSGWPSTLSVKREEWLVLQAGGIKIIGMEEAMKEIKEEKEN